MTDAVTEATRRAQALSPSADSAPSPFVKLQPGRSATLDVAFTYTQVPPGQFTFDGVSGPSPNWVLHLNARDNDYYQNGIPGVTSSVAQTAHWLRAVAASLDVGTLRMVGGSMGGYAALLFGDLVAADAVYAFSPVLFPGHLFGRTANFVDASPALPRLAGRLVVTFGAFELGDYQYLQPCLQAGLDFRQVALLANFHPGLSSIDLAALFASPAALDAGALSRHPHPARLDRHDVRLLAEVVEVVAARDHALACATLAPLALRDAENAGLHYRLGVHQALAGWPAAAGVSFRRARRLLDAIGVAVLGADADLKQRSLRDYAHLLDFSALQRVHAAIEAAG